MKGVRNQESGVGESRKQKERITNQPKEQETLKTSMMAPELPSPEEGKRHGNENNNRNPFLDLPPEARSQLTHWLMTGMPLHVALAQANQEFKSRGSFAALLEFRELTVPGFLRGQRLWTAQNSQVLLAHPLPPDFDTAMDQAVKQRLWEILHNPDAKPGDWLNVGAWVLKYRDQELDRVKFAAEQRGNGVGADGPAGGGIKPAHLAEAEASLRLLK